MSGDTKHCNKTVLLGRIDKFVNRDLTFHYVASKLSLYLTTHFKDSLPRYSVNYATIVRWSNQFEMTISALLQDENIENCHLFDVIIKEPKDVVEAIHLSVGH